MTEERPKVAPEVLVRVTMECRVCGKVVECFTDDGHEGPRVTPYPKDGPNRRKPISVEVAASGCTYEMTKHLKVAHGLSDEVAP